MQRNKQTMRHKQHQPQTSKKRETAVQIFPHFDAPIVIQKILYPK